LKALLVAVASFLLSAPNDSQGIPRSKLVDTFTDAVKSITEENRTLIVSFQRQAEQFMIAQDDPQYVDIKEKLEKAQKIAQKIKVIAIIPSMTIKEVKV
jgi:hypothetical protein